MPKVSQAAHIAAMNIAVAPTGPTKTLGRTYATKTLGRTYPTKELGHTYPTKALGRTYPTKDLGRTYPTKDLGRTYPTKDLGRTYPTKDLGMGTPAEIASASQKQVESAAATASAVMTGKPLLQSYQKVTDAGIPSGSTEAELPSYALPTEDKWEPPKDASKDAPKDEQTKLVTESEPLASKTLAAMTPVQTISTTATVTLPSLWQRFLTFLGFGHKATSTVFGSTIHGESGMSMSSVKQAAESCVRRVRAGDQNAMALMALVRDNAAAGQPKAKNALRYMKMYIETHPINGMGSQIGNEYDEAVSWELGE